jgi:hypothetical protein
LRRFHLRVVERTDALVDAKVPEASAVADLTSLEGLIRPCVEQVRAVLARYRSVVKVLAERRLLDRTRASLRLVDEYLSLSVEQFLRKAVADMVRLPQGDVYTQLKQALMAEVLEEETRRRAAQLPSILSPTGENEEYMHRLGFLKKFCMNILFLAARREQRRSGFEEALFATAAGLAMAFATAVAFWAQARFPQVSLNFFLILVVGYMMKDRIKEGLRQIFAGYAARRLYDRSTVITDPVTKRRVGLCKEKVDFGRAVKIPEEILRLRRGDDLATAAHGELDEMVIRYQKQIVLNSELLPRKREGVTGVTDIIRYNVDRFLRDMDDPEFALEYVNLGDFSVGKIKAAKRYRVDMVFRFMVDDADQQRSSTQLVRLVLDRNGIKRMVRVSEPAAASPAEAPVRPAA